MPHKPANSTTLRNFVSFNGYSEGREIVSIIQVIFDHTKIMYYTMWSGLSHPKWTDSREIKENCFDLLINFWETRLNEVTKVMKNDG